MDRARDIAVRLENVEEGLKKLKGRGDEEASIRTKHLTGIGEHLRTQLLEELDWIHEQKPELEIKQKKKLKR
ncbi:hypothetical protein [Bradyrhizobium glycinis]|uniref:hypothetical protein n=1 Tax=Bradyrhizobium glycinis TaxID=2751812 RepID=UPI0018D6226A|nr:hypothetical protein [Bradyrhizobium glycinis]MBH5373448.1 hypothetical protein [Bradyrhizobium glycinis]